MDKTSRVVEGVDDSGWCETLMAIHGGDNALNGGQTQVVCNKAGPEERIFNPKDTGRVTTPSR